MVVDLSAVPHELRRKMDEVMRRDYDVEVMRALERQKAAAAERWRNAPRWKDGFGPMVMQLDPVFEVMYRQAWGDHWKEDADRVRWVLKHCPEAQVRAQSGKVMVVSPGVAGCARRVKSYG